jgi:hypothetical protein
MSKFHEPVRIIRTFLSFTRSELSDRFQRKRVWSPQSVMVWLLLLTFPDRKTSYRNSLPVLMRFAQRVFGWTKLPSLGSVTPARAKMTTAACRSILHNVAQRCQQAVGTVKHRHGSRRFIAFDGTRLVTQRSADTARKLHRFSKPDGDRVHNPQGLLVTAVDVFRRLPLDWIFVGKGVGERTALNGLLDTLILKRGDVAVMDRGLPSRKLFGLLLDRGVDVIARMSTSRAIAWKEVAIFLKSGKKSGVIDIQVGAKGTKRTVRARLVERDRRRGRPRKGTKKENMVILTTLAEEDGFTRQEIVKLYAARWGIESLFKELKSFMSIEPMHTKRVAGCEQEICASLIWMALATMLQAEAESDLNGRRVVRADCLRAASDLIGELLEGRSIDDRLILYRDALRQYAYTPQSGRHAPRECKMPYGRSIQRGG